MLSLGVEETEAIGEQLAKSLRPGQIVWLSGDLGAGKTAFVRGLARGLGCEGMVTSPTYTLVHEYSGEIPLFHFDIYRLNDYDDLLDIGWLDYLDRGGVCAVEWAQRLNPIPDGTKVTFEITEEGREIHIDDNDA